MKKKNRQLIFKATLLLLSLFLLIFAGSLAWFTYGTSAYADGLGVKAKADGVEVSWDGINYYDNLTLDDPNAKVTNSTGYAYFYNLKELGGDGDTTREFSSEVLKLISGNGLKFFEPYTNRRTGTLLAASDGKLEGIEVSDSNSEGKYVDVPLYFRSTTERSVYLAGDSRVEPKSTTSNKSEYGDFSKNYIAAASRIAFLNEDKNECSFVWAPNADVELKESDKGYTIFEDLTHIEGSVSDYSKIPEAMLHEKDGKNYYIWFPVDYTQDNITQFSQLKCYEMTFVPMDGDKGLYVFSSEDFKLDIVPKRDNMDIPYIITTSTAIPYSSTEVNVQNTFNTKDPGDKTQPWAGPVDSTFGLNFNDNQTRPVPKINYSGFQNKKVTIEIGFNPHDNSIDSKDGKNYSNAAILLGYSGGNKTYQRYKEGTGEEEKNYFELPNAETNCALVNPSSSVAVSANEHFKKSVLFKTSEKTSIWPISITLMEQFTAKKSGEKEDATYKFLNKESNQYLAVSGGKPTINSTGSDFKLEYIEGLTYPALKTGDYYLVVKNGTPVFVALDALINNEIVTIYTGDAYSLLVGNGELEAEYTYLDKDKVGGVAKFGTDTTWNVFTSNFDTPESTTIGEKIVDINTPQDFYETIEPDTPENDELTGNEADGSDEVQTRKTTYYTAKIYIRIWVEGTDREAKTPLAGGIFNTKLHFKSQ